MSNDVDTSIFRIRQIKLLDDAVWNIQFKLAADDDEQQLANYVRHESLENQDISTSTI